MTNYPLSLPTGKPLITLTHPSPEIWIVELHNGQDSRLTADLVNNGLKPALDLVENEWKESLSSAKGKKGKDKEEAGKGALIIVGNKSQDKFFSNGLDFASVVGDPNFFPDTFNPLLARLITFPIPTIAAINGHCFAGGFMLSLACDYRVMTAGSKRNAWICMNEVHFGAVWPNSFAAILSTKIGDGRVQRQVALEGHRFTASEALKVGLIDYIAEGDTQVVLDKATEFAKEISGNARTGVWGAIKEDLYLDTLIRVRDKKAAVRKAKL